MKKFITLALSACLLITAFNLQAQTYVNTNATGNNDGTSWADAYTELHDALENYSPNDEIWVAAGIYLPENPSLWTDTIKRTFYLHQDISLYGGFNGTETTVDQRDPVANVTILSGDVNGDDVVDDFDNNKEDNVVNVVYVEATISTASTIDGFTIHGGYADIDDGVFPNKRGGGIFTYGAVQIRNCYFTQNYTIWHAGGIYYFESGAEGGKVEDCIFEKNKCLKFGGGMAVADLSGPGVSVENCQFLKNEAESGGGFYNFRATSTLEGCQFFDNKSLVLGGGMFTYNRIGGNNLTTTVSDCAFDGNTSANCGGFYLESDNGIDNEIIIKSSSFTNNEASPTALDSVAEVGAIGIVYLDGNPENCNIQIRDCLIENNSAEADMGGIGIVNLSGVNNHLEVTNCQIFNNTTTFGTVGGMGFFEGGNETTSVKISNTHFKGNSATVIPGFALTHLDNSSSPTSRNVELVNCLFSEHHLLSQNSAVIGNTNSEITLTNCTIANNEMPSIGNIESGEINLQNTILQSIDFPNLASGGIFVPGEIVSLGGNLISDDALDASINNTDHTNSDPLFEMSTFQLSLNSPAVDAGISPDDVSEFDLAGNNRLQGGCIDIGAYESGFDAGTDCQMITAVKEVLANSEAMFIYPNPVSDVTSISIENNWTGTFSLRVVNALGQEVHSAPFGKLEPSALIELKVAHLPKGVYRVLLSNGEEMLVQTFVKI